jgi:hypothetical protein
MMAFAEICQLHIAVNLRLLHIGFAECLGCRQGAFTGAVGRKACAVKLAAAGFEIRRDYLRVPAAAGRNFDHGHAGLNAEEQECFFGVAVLVAGFFFVAAMVAGEDSIKPRTVILWRGFGFDRFGSLSRIVSAAAGAQGQSHCTKAPCPGPGQGFT